MTKYDGKRVNDNGKYYKHTGMGLCCFCKRLMMETDIWANVR